MKTSNFVKVLCLFWALLTGVLSSHAKPESERREEQRHGYVFEKWVRDTFFEGYQAESYTQHWDVAAEANKNYGGVPVSIKTAKYGSPVDLGDAVRQFRIDERFLLIIGYWKQEDERKRIVNVVAATVEPKLWAKLWEPITLDELLKLDAVVKDRTLSPAEARLAARKMKSVPPFTKAAIGVNPKIDTKGQRRLQCSLSFKEVFQYLAPKADPAPQLKPKLFGIDVLEPFESPSRR